MTPTGSARPLPCNLEVKWVEGIEGWQNSAMSTLGFLGAGQMASALADGIGTCVGGSAATGGDGRLADVMMSLFTTG